MRAITANPGGGLHVETTNGGFDVDGAVVTPAAPLAAAICPELTAGELDRLNGVTYQGIVCASVVLRRPLGGYYLTYITDPATPFTAVVEMTAFVPPSELAGNHLVYLPKYVAPDDPLLDADDDAVRASFVPYLKRMYPDLRRRRRARVQGVARARACSPCPRCDFSDVMPAQRTSIPGLELAGSAQLPFATLNVNDTLSLLEERPA